MDADYRTTAIGHGARVSFDVHPVQRPPCVKGPAEIPKQWTIGRGVGWLMHHRILACDYETHPHRSEAVIHLMTRPPHQRNHLELARNLPGTRHESTDQTLSNAVRESRERSMPTQAPACE